MFGEVRRHFGVRWRDMRERGTLRLFAFEFFVVVLGVLAAQAIQNWAQERDKEAVARGELRRLTAAYYDAHETAEVWRKATPCLRSAVETIVRDAATGGQPEVRFLQRPRLFGGRAPDATADNWTRIESFIGTDAKIALEDARNRNEAIRDYNLILLEKWERFRLLEPALGPVSERDRAAARDAGIDVLTALRNIDIAILNLDEESGIRQGPDPEPFNRKVDGLPVRTCDAIWRNGRIYRDPALDT